MFWIIPCTIKTYREDSIHLVSVIIFLKASIVVLCYTYLPHFQMHLCLYHFLLSKADLVSLSSAWGVCGWVGGCVCVCVCVCLCVCLWCVCVCVCDFRTLATTTEACPLSYFANNRKTQLTSSLFLFFKLLFVAVSDFASVSTLGRAC